MGCFMKALIKKIIKSLISRDFDYCFSLWEKFKPYFYVQYVSHGQNMEDCVLVHLLDGKKNGVYVDVGAHNPVRFSNTYRLFREGWSGINVDPLPGCMDSFNKQRPNDVNLNIGCSKNAGELVYYSFEEPAYNTFDEVRAATVSQKGYSTLKEKLTVPVERLDTILDKYLGNRVIDVLTLDVEKRELDVLESNNWAKYRPQIIVMESLVSVNESLDKIYDDPAVAYLVDKGYIAVAKLSNAVFFRETKQ